MDLTRMPEEAVEHLARELHQRGYVFKKVVGGAESSRAFAAVWCDLTDTKVTHTMDQGVYELADVVTPKLTS